MDNQNHIVNNNFEEQWWLDCVKLRTMLVKRAQERWNLSEWEAEMLAEKTLEQPAIHQMMEGNIPKKKLDQKLLSSRLSQNVYRYLQSRKEVAFPSDYAISDQTYRKTLNRMLAQALISALSSLNEDEQEIFVMRLYHEESFDTIGKFLKVSEASARMKWHRISLKLREKLKEWL